MRSPDPSTARRDALWTLAFLAFVLLWDASGADLRIVRSFGGLQLRLAKRMGAGPCLP